MIYISRIKMRGFKSFKLADIILPRDFVCLAGPNGSGKSNVCDAVRFAFGETSLKAMRARRVKDLISHSTKIAEVTLYLDGEEKHEIRRAIRDDGKIQYRLDGGKTTRTSILNLLKKFNIDESGRNTIAQGEVTRIIQMGGKERRQIIDSVAGISEFEDKKKEAMRDLEVVDTRLREANIVLGEKIGMLNELEKEKAVALQYLEHRKAFNNARGSLVKKEMERLSSDLEKAINDSQKVSNSMKAKQAELAELDERIKALEGEKGAFLSEIEARQQQSALSKGLEALKLSIGKDELELEEKKSQIGRLESEAAALQEDLGREREEAKSAEDGHRRSEEEFNSLKSQREAALRLSGESRLRRSLDEQKAKLSLLRESLIRMEGEITAAEQLLSEKEGSIGVSISENGEQAAKLANEIELLRNEVAESKTRLESMFEREKEANAEMAELDRRILSLREKVAALRAQNPRIASNALMDFISQLKAKEKGSGVHGTLIDLIKFDAKYSNAIEAAAGQRLLYVVVDDADTATRLISKIKERGAGRATFIPLKEVKVPAGVPNEGLGALVDFIKCDAKVEKAVQYAFGDTILVSNMEEAKKIGVGKRRMVTLDGEIFDRSGVITGGKTSTGIAAAGALSRLEGEVAEVKAARESLLSEITGMREDMAKVRSQRAEKEVRLKSSEMELAALKGEQEKARREMEDAAKKRSEAETLRSRIKSLSAKKSEAEKEASSLSEKISAGEKALEADEQQLARQNEEAARKHAELAARVSALETRKEALFNEIKIRKTAIHRSEAKLKQLQEERSACSSKVSGLERRLSSQRSELERKEKELASSSKDLEQLFKKMKEREEKIQGIGKQRGALSYECEKLNKDLGALTVKKATSETRLADLTAEFSSIKEFEFLDRPKDELIQMSKAADAFLSANPNANLASIELYDRKNAEIGDVRDRMRKLGEEKDAIMKMIEEIDTRKKDTFFRTFYSVNDNFRKMFRYIPQVGEGYLYLDKPNEPFESGLFLRIKRGTKEMGLEALSGGENSLIALMFIFALQFVKPSPYYVLDEVDSALDKENSKNLAKLIKEMSRNSQFVLVTHNDMVMTFASAVFGVSRSDGVSRIVGVKLGEKLDSRPAAAAQPSSS